MSKRAIAVGRGYAIIWTPDQAPFRKHVIGHWSDRSKAGEWAAANCHGLYEVVEYGDFIPTKEDK